MSDRTQISGRLVTGLVIIVVGVLFTLDNAGIVEAGTYLRWWPVLLVLAGVAKLTGIGALRNTGAGLVLLVIGAWLTLNQTHLLGISFWRFWPAVLVIVGGCMVYRAFRPASAKRSVDSSDSLRSFAFMSGDVRKCGSRLFRGGEATAVMGGCEIDLRDARMPDGQAVLDLMAIMGGIELKIPADWGVSSQLTPLLGGYEDKTTPPTISTGLLVLRGLVLMGGVVVKN